MTNKHAGLSVEKLLIYTRVYNTYFNANYFKIGLGASRRRHNYFSTARYTSLYYRFCFEDESRLLRARVFSLFPLIGHDVPMILLKIFSLARLVARILGLHRRHFLAQILKTALVLELLVIKKQRMPSPNLASMASLNLAFITPTMIWPDAMKHRRR